ncbi:MAG: IS630 transposase-related protein [Treponema sp.]|nr:IS630 transposase-related protein [Treponema sp.]
MAYSEDFRKAAIEYIDKGHSEKELVEAFGIYGSRVREWRKLLQKTGSLEPQYKETRKSKIDMKELAAALERKPDATLEELAKPFGVTESAVHYAMERLKVTVKKTVHV